MSLDAVPAAASAHPVGAPVGPDAVPAPLPELPRLAGPDAPLPTLARRASGTPLAGLLGRVDAPAAPAADPGALPSAAPGAAPGPAPAAAPAGSTPGAALAGGIAWPAPSADPERALRWNETIGTLPSVAAARRVARRWRAARRAARWTLQAGARAALVGVVAYTLLFNFSVVRGNSMAPSIHDGDRILVNHLSLLFGEIGRGDIVVLRYPLDPSVDYIKRVIGVPGDAVRIVAGEVFVNGEHLDEPYLGTPDPYTEVDTQVLAGHYFVLGDNRLHSSDSREFGQVPAAFLRGVVDVRVWPPSRAGLLE